MEDGVDEISKIESLCTNCEKNGTTILYPKEIPFYRTVLISSFSCPHCHLQNNTVESIAPLQPFGEDLTLRLLTAADLDRHLVISEYCTFRIAQLQFEMPPCNRRTHFSTVEGTILKVAENLEEKIAQDAKLLPAEREQLAAFVAKLKQLLDREHFAPFEVELSDPSGNSYVENYLAPKSDPQIVSRKYKVSDETFEQLGLKAAADTAPRAAGPPQSAEPPVAISAWPIDVDVADLDKYESERLPIECPSCFAPGEHKICEIDIPGFRRCWIMAFVCEKCAYRSSEVKPCMAFAELACRRTLRVESERDLQRDFLKSEYASVAIPELQLALEEGSLGGVYTTVEGLLKKLAEEITEKFPFFGDSVDEARKQRIQQLAAALQQFSEGKNLPFTLVLDDPVDHSHIGAREAELLFYSVKKQLELGETPAPAAPAAAEDAQLTVEQYARTQEQNELLGLALPDETN